ncbi:hypothetical protein I550_3544 [Mycobacterium intracellulare 1956]|uniref:Uncharacterized protein n=1 Tax=Mycobacterium intracellulare 1956 TaxID=1299331 RepID=X8CH43_MYCIT|nr:hypothetical protein I548_0763 [Mycobacterium intracellulare]EUA55389.1 hypothetical protein I550_3544 [Mycobacterium intracellulare 1956]
MSEPAAAPTNDGFCRQNITPELRGYRADARWHGMRSKFIAGGGIQRRADDIRAEW